MSYHFRQRLQERYGIEIGEQFTEILRQEIHQNDSQRILARLALSKRLSFCVVKIHGKCVNLLYRKSRSKGKQGVILTAFPPRVTFYAFLPKRIREDKWSCRVICNRLIYEYRVILKTLNEERSLPIELQSHPQLHKLYFDNHCWTPLVIIDLLHNHPVLREMIKTSAQILQDD